MNTHPPSESGSRTVAARETARFPLLTVVALTLLMMVCSPAALLAQLSIAVSPIRVEHEVLPGQTKTDNVIVENHSGRTVRLRISLADWHLTLDGTPMFEKPDQSSPFSMTDWVVVNPSELEVAPQQVSAVRYTVKVPEGTPEGGYRTALLVESIPEITPGRRPARAYLNVRIGAIIYNQVGTMVPEGEIVRQRVVSNPEEDGKMAVQVTLRNSGIFYFRFTGESRIVDAQGNVLESLPIHDSVVLPQSERDIRLPLSSAPPSSGFSIVSSLDIGLEELLTATTRVEPSAPNLLLAEGSDEQDAK